MRKKGILFFLAVCFVAIGCANGASRSISSQPVRNERAASSIPARTASTTVSRTKKQNVASRSAKTTKTSARTAITSKSGTRTTRDKQQTTRARISSLLTPIKRVIGRTATTDTPTVTSNPGFGADYTNCRDAYFACMDQFCANTDETYRRCICSSRLNEIKQKQSTLSHTAESLENFKGLNLDVIDKSTGEVQAMMSATDGEQIAATAKDKSDSAQQLSAIGNVLSKTRTKSLSNAGTLDAGGDIKAIWATTDLANGANIANLTGDKLFNAVNAQCSEMVTEQCTPSVLNMVISAYGMYIENDCAALATDLGKKKNAANSTIRETQREMNVARLENYDAHNSLPINDCIASIRQDLTNNMACGPELVHCWDVTGLYLTIDKGEPIYTAKFYNLANQTSLSGNILNNKTNNVIVSALNNKKVFAEKSLDKCRDLSASIWDEFMRQAIIEIHQKQQEKIREVKTECLGVVNQCYDTQTEQLKQFNDTADQTLLGLTMETVEDLCKTKLDTCSNLYGGGPQGLAALVNEMRDIVEQRIVAECQNFLTDFGKDLCAVQSTDTLHAYPYGCRVYEPGTQQDATTSSKQNTLYQRFVNYAMQVCIRPSEYETINDTKIVPTQILQEINIAMDKMHIAMNQELSKECERLGGEWVSNPYSTSSNAALYEKFYTETGSSKNWGYCREVTTEPAQYVITFDNGDNGTSTQSTVVTYGETMSSVSVPEYYDSDNSSVVFYGYYTQPNGAGIQYYDANGNATRAYDISSDTILYAYWLTSHVTVPTQAGCTFLGYYSDPEFNTLIYMPNGDLQSGATPTTEMYPKWECRIVYFCVLNNYDNVGSPCASTGDNIVDNNNLPTSYIAGQGTSIPALTHNVTFGNWRGWKLGTNASSSTLPQTTITIPTNATGLQRVYGYYCHCRV